MRTFACAAVLALAAALAVPPASAADYKGEYRLSTVIGTALP
jgi:hypothetical protein